MRIVQDMAALFFPAVCPGCGESLSANEHILCSHCLFSLEGMKMKNGMNRSLDGRLPLKYCLSLFRFPGKGIVRNMMHHIKYQGRDDLARWLGRQAALHFRNDLGGPAPDLLVPVPIGRARLHHRGFNQSREIALGIQEVLEVPVVEILEKSSGKRGSQTRKNRQDRWERVQHSFRLKRPPQEGRHVLLVDDVITTGATLEACALCIMEEADVRLSVITLAFADS